jgi:hypothetical protein
MNKMRIGQDGLARPDRRIKLPPYIKRGPDTVWGDYNEINIEDSQDERKAKVEQWIAMQIGSKLMRVYNQREWKVIVDIPGQMLIIACDSVSNEKGYHISMVGRNVEELQRRAIMAAGEILERHNVSRSRNFNADNLEDLPRDSMDNVIAPDAAPEPV